MSTNRVSNIASNSVKQTLNSKTGELLQRKITRMPYVDVADRFLNDKKTSDAIKASMLPVVKKVENKNWQTALETEFNKPENQEIKKDYEKIKANIDFAKFPKFNPKTLNKIIANLKNRQDWLNNLHDEIIEEKYLKQIFQDRLIDCFPNKNKIQSIPKYNPTNFETQKNNIKTTLEELAQNEETFQIIKKDLCLGENAKADEYKEYSLETWYPLINELKKSDKFEDTLVLNDILKYINKSVMEDRKLIQEAKEKNIPNANPKNIIPFFNEELFEKASKMKGNQPFMNHYETCYKDNIIQKYSLHYDKDGIATKTENGFYHLDLNKKRKDTSGELHENELQFISPDSWCTKSFNSKQYKELEHFYIILDQNKKVKIGSGYDSSMKFYEITDENNCIDNIDIDLIEQISSLYTSEELKKIKEQNLAHNLSLLVLYSITTKNNYFNKLSEIQGEDEKNKFIREIRSSYQSALKNLNLETLTKDELIGGLLNPQSKEYINLNHVKLYLELLELDSTLDDKTIDRFRKFNHTCYSSNRLKEAPDYEALGFPIQNYSSLFNDIVSLSHTDLDLDYKRPDLNILDDNTLTLPEVPPLPPLPPLPPQA